jgi:hypothetical protein
VKYRDYTPPPNRKFRLTVELIVEAPFAHEAESKARWLLDYHGLRNARVMDDTVEVKR